MKSDSSQTAEIESVVESVRTGDRDALESLFSNHRKYLRHLVGLWMEEGLRLRVDPSDIVQEAQIEALRRVDDYAQQPSLPVRLWMRQIALDRLNMAKRRHLGAQKRTLRREFTLPENSSLSIAQQLVDGFASPSFHASKREVAEKVREAVDRLKEEDREILLLQAFEGLTSTESSQLLGIEPATARKRFGRALLRLRTLLVAAGLGASES